jgi:epsin
MSEVPSSKAGSPYFYEFKKQASFFLKEKIKTARLALTDITPIQLLTEEATNGNPLTPDTRTLKMISKAAFEVDDYWRIVDILHKRLERFDKKEWRSSYNALIVLEHLLTQGPESSAEEFQTEKTVMEEMESFQYIGEKGFNWGLNVRRKSEKILTLLNDVTILKEERDRARKLSRGIEGFGSICNRKEGIHYDPAYSSYSRSNSQISEYADEKLKVADEEDHPFNDAENLTSVSLISC